MSFFRKKKKVPPAVLTHMQIQDVLERISYVDGSSFCHVPDGGYVTFDDREGSRFDGPLLYVITPVVGVIDKQPTTLFTALRTEARSPEDVVRQITSLCVLAATHEVHEWLKLDGECVVGPHPIGVPS